MPRALRPEAGKAAGMVPERPDAAAGLMVSALMPAPIAVMRHALSPVVEANPMQRAPLIGTDHAPRRAAAAMAPEANHQANPPVLAQEVIAQEMMAPETTALKTITAGARAGELANYCRRMARAQDCDPCWRRHAANR